MLFGFGHFFPCILNICAGRCFGCSSLASFTCGLGTYTLLMDVFNLQETHYKTTVLNFWNITINSLINIQKLETVSKCVKKHQNRWHLWSYLCISHYILTKNWCNSPSVKLWARILLLDLQLVAFLFGLASWLVSSFLLLPGVSFSLRPPWLSFQPLPCESSLPLPKIIWNNLD